MLVATQYNSILNLANYDAFEMIYKGYYNRSEYIISAIIFDADGNVIVEDPVCQFGSVEEANTYLKNVEDNTGYIRIPTKPTSLIPKSATLLNLARFDVVKIISHSSKSPPPSQTRISPSGIGVASKGKSGKGEVIKAVKYDAIGEEEKIYHLGSFADKKQAVEYLKSLNV